jgi:hypothetical protein
VDASYNLVELRAPNDEQYNLDICAEIKKGMLFISEYLMPEVKRSIKEKSIHGVLLKESKVDTFQMLVGEDELAKTVRQYMYQQVKSNVSNV